MRFFGKFAGGSAALVMGSLLFLAPDLMTGSGAVSGSLPVDAAWAEPDRAAIARIKKIDSADDAWFEAAMDIERFGETPSSLARLKVADDAYFEAVIAMETANRNARQYARIEAADDAWFTTAMDIEYFGETPGRLSRLDSADHAYANAVIALEDSARTMTRLAELKAEERRRPPTMLAAARMDDIVTGSLPKDMAAAVAADPMTAQLDRIKQADDAYFDAVMALETEGENPDRLARLKAADDAYFDAVLAIETLQAKGTEAPKVKLASANAGTRSDRTHAAHRAEERQPAPSAGAVSAKRRTHAPAHTRQAGLEKRFEERGPVAKLFRIFVKGIGFIPSRL